MRVIGLAIKYAISKFAKRYDYNVDYLHAMEASAPGSLWRYALTAPLAQRRTTVPPQAYFAAKLIAARQQDCGPCVQLVINMAREAGVNEQTLLDVLAEDDGLLSEDALLAVQFSRGVLAGVADPDVAAAVTRRWGQGALVDLSLAVAFGGFYPVLKRGLGYAQSCSLAPHTGLGRTKFGVTG
ncbi:MAG: hypothetical protein AAF993_01905 [Pseudomonadota bacterium]